MALYLWINGIVYLGLGAWCAILPDKTSQAIGFGLTNASARSEYITVYGGLEIGMGIFFCLCAAQPGLRSAGVLFGLCLYAALAIFRVGTLVALEGVGSFPKTMVVVEIGMAVWAALLWFKAR